MGTHSSCVWFTLSVIFDRLKRPVYSGAVSCPGFSGRITPPNPRCVHLDETDRSGLCLSYANRRRVILILQQAT